ncbi:MAG TPA: hypothetical protein VEL76_27465 [Gemmataceae bacterium]|nr:hypothetical protein [Gemmataceae bacterium]
MAGDLREFLSRLPANIRIDQLTSELLDREIRAGADLNYLQRDNLTRIVQHAVEQNTLPPAPYESFLAYVYLEWSDEAKRSEDAKPRLLELVKRLKATPPLASAVGQLAQQVAQEREARRKRDIEKLAAAVTGPAHEATNNKTSGGAGADPPNVLVKRMQAARMGGGDKGMSNLDLAAQYAEEAVEAYPHYPKILFEAAGCHQLAAEKGTHLSLTDRYVHMKQAYSLYQQCLTILAAEPYVKLKGEYDVWRKGITELIPRVQQKLAFLEEKQQ